MDSGTGWEESSVEIDTAVDSGNLMADNGVDFIFNRVFVSTGYDTGTSSLCFISRSVVSDTKGAGSDV